LHAGDAIGLLTFTTLVESVEQPDQQQYDGQTSPTPPNLAFHANQALEGAPRPMEEISESTTIELPTHAPVRYDCPFCRIVAGKPTPTSSLEDVVYRDDAVTAFVAAEWWPNNPGAVLVVTNRHVENLYELPDRLGTPIIRAMRLVALAMKEAYDCPGTSTRQHNEPAGGQEVWHYHQHVFPRYPEDHLYQLNEHRAPAPAEQRASYAQALRSALVTLAETGGDR
jgi:histidine triad (HIT) family protein